MNNFKQHKEGIILTLLFHALLVIILFRFGFFTPLPLPEDKGILVDFGMNDAGLGKIEPKPKPVKIPEPKPQEESTPPEPVKPKPTPPEPQVNEAKEEVMTQDFEETVAVDEGKKKKEEEERKKREAEERKRKEAEKKKKQEELEELRKEELARLEREAKEKRRRDSLRKIEEARLSELQRIAEQRRKDSIKRAEEEARIAAINDRAKNVFGGGATSGSTSQSEGVTYGGGNQGSPNGTPNVNKYDLGGGEGISFNLVGRSAESLQKPTYPGQEEGVVVVQITVDKYGKVTKAEPGVRGSTSLDSGLLNAAKRAALSTRFNENPNAPAFQTGTITYRFVLN